MTSTPASTQLLVALEGQARAAGGVLGVADDQAEPPAVDQPGQDLADDLAAGRADDVADEEDFQGHGGSFRAGRTVGLARPFGSPRELDAPRLAEDRDLDLAGIGQLLLDRPGRCRGRAWRRPRRRVAGCRR